MDGSDKTRRTMSDALHSGKLTEEARAFVTGSPSKPAPEQPPVPAGESVSSATGDAPATAPQDRAEDEARSSWNEPPHLSVVIPAIVSMTFRLPASLSYRLARVSAERKLRRERPFSQQDIVAEALERWLQRHAGSQ
jgi:hypothetical protein